MLSLLYLLVVIVISKATAKPEYQYTVCFTGGDYAPNSTYHTNLKALLLSRLTSNTQIDYGFYNSSYGGLKDEVYATGLCRGDVTPTTCRSCLNDSSFLLLKECPHQKEAFGGYDKCTLHYAHRTIFGYDSYEHAFGVYNVSGNTTTIKPYSAGWVRLHGSNDAYVSSDTNVTNWDEYNYVLTNLLSRLRVKAATGDSNPNRKFAAGKAKVAGQSHQTIYAVVQCSPDILEAECNDCLAGAFSEIPKYCYNKSGGAIIRFSCNFRYQNSSFCDPMADELTLQLQLSPQGSPALPATNSSHTTHHGNKNRSRAVMVKVVPTVAFVGLLIFICIYFIMRKKTKYVESEPKAVSENKQESSQFDFDTIRIATNDFSDANKLGQGGFGPVYKGRLFNEQEIAVKRLAGNSGQGDTEFKNEVLLMAKLKHRNLIRLLGFCSKREERLLIYEFLPNKSLDYYLFDPTKRAHLYWNTRYKLIEGIARGLLYLHEDSQQRIIHRDLKPSNILLLDAEMNPKISDFGLARLFVVDQTQAVASKIAGTLGYMAPEYARHGKFSAKSDVFSFGVIILEIVSGQKNSGFHNGENVEHLSSFAWKNWMKGTISDIIDPTLNDASRNEIVRCIHIGLLCVQERVADRPTLASVVLMLDSHSFSLPNPLQPAFFMNYRCLPDIQFSECSYVATGSNEQKSNYVEASINEASISSLYPR